MITKRSEDRRRVATEFAKRLANTVACALAGMLFTYEMLLSQIRYVVLAALTSLCNLQVIA